MSDAGTFDYVDRRRRYGGMRTGRAAYGGSGRHCLPSGGGSVGRRRRQHPGVVRMDASARLGLRLGLPGGAAGTGQLVHAARARQGARRLLVAQLVHRVLAARRMPRRVGDHGRRRMERRRDRPLVRRLTGTVGLRDVPPDDPCGAAVLEAAANVGMPTVAFNRGETVCNGAGWFQINAAEDGTTELQLARLPAPDPGVAAQPRGSDRVLGVGDPVRRRAPPPACATSGRTSPGTTPCRRGARSSSPPARSTPRSCCCSPGSGPA